ncbi:cysteine rich repeat-containing protein [Roseixanthobacter pseudopolyaromaticivorans]|uniref:cysteine rich repeat-containing protein n=1 Tax=Xanthobacteraceae TaxID=335928 RepID=UPI003729706C
MPAIAFPRRALARLAFSFLIQSSLAAPSALAQDAGSAATKAALEACRTDAQKLCASVQPGGGRIMQCPQKQTDQISEGCRTALAAAQTQRVQ